MHTSCSSDNRGQASWLRRAAIALLAAAFLAIYLPDIAHGFIKDDFAWIRTGSAGIFFRPVVSAVFAFDFAAWGLNPFGYGITNLVLALLDAVLVALLVRRSSLPPAAAVFAAAVWAFNFHGISMSLRWLSGRTSLLVTLFCVAAAVAFVTGRRLLSGVLCFAALLSKEEAVMLPAILSAFTFLQLDGRAASARVRACFARAWPLWLSLAIYALLRVQSGALWPQSAPDYYQFSLSPPLVLRNLLEYADRGATTAGAVLLVLLAIVRMNPIAVLTRSERRVATLGLLWFVGSYAVTVLLPSRSSLYAVLPSVGSALCVAACGSAAVRLHPARFRIACALLTAAVLALIPVYRSRNMRWVEPAEMSTRVLRMLQNEATTRQPGGGRIVVIDDPYSRVNMDAMFGGLFPDAVALHLGNNWTGELVTTRHLPLPRELVFELRGAQMIRIDADEPPAR